MVLVWASGLLWMLFFLLTSLSSASDLSRASVIANADRNAARASIAPGTSITMQNWRQYNQFMSDGMRELFEGKYFWKMPADVELDVGQTVIHPLPKGYLEATEQARSQTKITSLPNGGLNIDSYFGGTPFPDPSEPHIGWKILANFWFRYFPHLVVNAPENLGFSCALDSYGSVNCVKGLWVYRQLSFNTDPGVPRTISGSQGQA